LFVLYQSDESGDTSGDESEDGRKDNAPQGILWFTINYVSIRTTNRGIATIKAPRDCLSKNFAIVGVSA